MSSPHFVPAETPVPQLPELAAIGCDTIRHAHSGKLAPHSHETMEICYVERGQVWSWVGTDLYEIFGGETYVTWPHEVHGAMHGVVNPCRRYLVRIALQPSSTTFLHLPDDEAAALVDALARLPRHFPAPPSLVPTWEELIAQSAAEPAPLAVAKLRALLLDLLLEVVAAAVPAAPQERSQLTRDAMLQMEQNLTHPLPLDEISNRLGWSVSHVQHRFRREVGISPGEWYLRRRVAESCRLLEQSDDAVTKIAFELGFSSSQYFATAFARVTGLSPTAFRRAARDGAPA